MTNPLDRPSLASPSLLPSHAALDPSFFALRDLFTGPLRDVSFPGVDANAVAELVAHAEAGAESVESARAALREAQTNLVAAEAAFADRRALLVSKAQLAVAYARVFAQDDPELLAAVESVSVPRLRSAASTPANVAAPAAPRKRGRPPKLQSAALPLESHEAGVAAE